MHSPTSRRRSTPRRARRSPPRATSATRSTRSSSGTADVSRDGEAVRTLGPGDVFGEVAVLASGRRTATVTATIPDDADRVFKRDVWALEQRSPEAAERLRGLVADRLAGQTS